MNAPILSRTALFDTLRDGSLRRLDWNLVNTSLGAMLEPVTLYRDGGTMKNDDVYDSAFTDVKVIGGTDVALLTQCGLSSQWPRVFNSL